MYINSTSDLAEGTVPILPLEVSQSPNTSAGDRMEEKFTRMFLLRLRVYGRCLVSD